MTNELLPKVAEQTITYTVSLTVTRPVRTYENDSEAPDVAAVAEWMVSREAKHQLERELLKALRKFDGHCDCEVMEVR